jgi:prevent-host-death family protein
MTTIPQKTLRNDIGDILRRAEAGEHFTITVAGRPAAELGPLRSRQWVSGQALAAVWQTPAPESLMDDLGRMGAKLTDPFA